MTHNQLLNGDFSHRHSFEDQRQVDSFPAALGGQTTLSQAPENERRGGLAVRATRWHPGDEHFNPGFKISDAKDAEPQPRFLALFDTLSAVPTEYFLMIDNFKQYDPLEQFSPKRHTLFQTRRSGVNTKRARKRKQRHRAIGRNRRLQTIDAHGPGAHTVYVMWIAKSCGEQVA